MTSRWGLRCAGVWPSRHGTICRSLRVKAKCRPFASRHKMYSFVPPKCVWCTSAPVIWCSHKFDRDRRTDTSSLFYLVDVRTGACAACMHLCTCTTTATTTAHLHLCTSALLHYAHLHLRTSETLKLCTSAPLHLFTSSPLLLCSSAPLHLCTTSAPAAAPLHMHNHLCTTASAPA